MIDVDVDKKKEIPEPIYGSGISVWEIVIL